MLCKLIVIRINKNQNACIVIFNNTSWLVPRGTVKFVSWESRSRETKFSVPLGTSQWFAKYYQTKFKANFEKHADPSDNKASFNCTFWSCATAVNISQVTVNCFPFDFMAFGGKQFHCQMSWPWKPLNGYTPVGKTPAV